MNLSYVPGPQKDVKSWAFGQLVEVLGHHFTYLWVQVAV